MELRFICYIIAVFLFCHGCNYSSNENVSKESLDTISIPKLDENKVFLYSKQCDTVRHLFLETNSNCLIGNISKIQFKDSLIYIGDFENTQSIFVFNLKGKFVKKLFKQGRGPGEYTTISMFNVDVYNNIYILDNRLGKEFIYSQDFRLIKENKLNSFFVTSAIGDTHRSIYYCGNEPNKEEFRYQVIIKDNIKNKFFKYFEYPSYSENLRFLNENHFRYNCDNIYLKPSYSKYIYSFNDSLMYSYFLMFDHSDQFFDTEIESGFKNAKELRKYIFENNIVDVYDYDVSSSWIYLKVQKGNSNYFVFYNRETGKCSVARRLGNDLLYSLLLGRVLGLYEDNIVSYVNPDFIRNNFEQSEIEKRFGNINELSNPIIILAKLKRNEN